MATIEPEKLKELLTDPVPVIRCRFCIHQDTVIGGMVHCKNLNKWFDPDFFCRDGAIEIKRGFKR